MKMPDLNPADSTGNADEILADHSWTGSSSLFELRLSPKFLLALHFILILGKIHCNEE